MQLDRSQNVSYQFNQMKLIKLILAYACFDTCCSHFLTIIAGVDLHFRHESELPVCRSRVTAVQGEVANHYTNDTVE